MLLLCCYVCEHHGLSTGLHHCIVSDQVFQYISSVSQVHAQFTSVTYINFDRKNLKVI